MKFFCEYCGCRIDAERDIKCPNCGASYEKNATFIRLEEEKNNEIRLIKEQNEQDRVDSVKTAKTSWTFIIIFTIIFVAVFVTISLVVINGFLKNKKPNTNSTNVLNTNDVVEFINETKEKEEDITVSINEYGKTSEYKVKVSEYENVNFWYKEPKEGYEFVKFYLVVENLVDKQIYRQDVNCIVDGIAQENDFTSGYSTIPLIISKGLAVKGEATFEVPKNASSYDIRYGDYITMHIEK